MKNRLLIETMVLNIVALHPNISAYRIREKCSYSEFHWRLAYCTVKNLVKDLIARDLLVRIGTHKIKITRFGESVLISNKAFIKTVLAPWHII